MNLRTSDKATDATIGHVSEARLNCLVDHLEESPKDVDYFINSQTLDRFETATASPALIAMLRQAVGSTGGIDIVWANR